MHIGESISNNNVYCRATSYEYHQMYPMDIYSTHAPAVKKVDMEFGKDKKGKLKNKQVFFVDRIFT